MNEASSILISILRHRRRSWVAWVGVVALASTVAGVMAVPWIGGRIIDSIVQAEAGEPQLVRWTLILALAAVVSSISRICYRLVFTWWSAASVQKLRDRMVDFLQRAELRLFDHQRTGLLSSLFANDAALVGRIYHPVGSDFLRSILQLVAILVIVSTQFSAIGWSLVPLIPFYLAFPLLFSRRIRGASQSLQEARAEALSGVQETLEGVREIKALGREKWNSGRLGRHFGAVVGARVRAEKLRSVFEVEFALYWVFLGLMYWWGGRRVLAGEMSIGELVAFLGYVGYVRGPVSRLVSINTDLQESLAAARRILRLFTEPLENAGGTRTFPPTSETPTIEFKQVTFCYDGHEIPALADVSFQVEPGTTVGLVGPSGAGKSTLVKLLIRFYDPQEGRIVVGGYDVRDYDINSLRSGFGIVLQEPFLFSGTIRENIALGDPGAGDGSIREAARIANASAFIEALPEGYDTQIGEKGARLSGGQNQRIAIARVALSNPRILILDEATSALDARADQHVSEALQRLMRGRTSMIIAHRLSTVVNADELLLLDEGRLVAKGRHDDLITRSRLYERLYTLQFAEEAEKSAVGGELGAGV